VKRVCLYILFPILFLNSSFNEIFKLPQLVSHFLQHQQLNSDLGVLEFLSMHYYGDDLNDNDDDEDMKLPFKKVTVLGHISHAVPVASFTLLEQYSFRILSIPRIPQQDLMINPALGALFRPPRA